MDDDSGARSGNNKCNGDFSRRNWNCKNPFPNRQEYEDYPSCHRESEVSRRNSRVLMMLSTLMSFHSSSCGSLVVCSRFVPNSVPKQMLPHLKGPSSYLDTPFMSIAVIRNEKGPLVSGPQLRGEDLNLRPLGYEFVNDLTRLCL